MDKKSTETQSAVKTLLVAPQPDVVTEGILELFAVVELEDVFKAIASDALIVTFQNVRVLECLLEYRDLFGVELGVLRGLPGADYSVAFDQVVYSLDAISYDTLVADAMADTRISALRDAEKAARVNPDDASSRPAKAKRDDEDDDVTPPSSSPMAWDPHGRS